MDGLVLDQKASHLAGGITRVEKAKIGLIQFCISPPKTDVRKEGGRRGREGGKERRGEGGGREGEERGEGGKERRGEAERGEGGGRKRREGGRGMRRKEP